VVRPVPLRNFQNCHAALSGIPRLVESFIDYTPFLLDVECKLRFTVRHIDSDVVRVYDCLSRPKCGPCLVSELPPGEPPCSSKRSHTYR
jgi:hypothetical protein